MSFDAILEEIENSDEILDFRFEKNDIPLYLPIRFLLMQSIINTRFNLSNPHLMPMKSSMVEIGKYLFYTLKSNLFFAPPKDIYIFSSGIVNRLEQGKYKNRLYSYFFSLYPTQTQIIEASVKRSYLVPKTEKVYFKDLIDIVSILIAKVMKVSNKDKKSIEMFLEYLRLHGKFHCTDKILFDIKTILLLCARKYRVSIFLYTLLFKIKKPKLIIVEDGCYGGYSYIFKVARDLGIKTAEYQHGYVGLSHPAYNIAPCLYHKIKYYLPEFFLTHGDYWSDRIRIPSEKISVGFPDLTHQLQEYKRHQNKKKRKIVFISGGTCHKELVDFVLSVVKPLHEMGYEIVFKPHPSEVSGMSQRYGVLHEKGILIQTSNLYDILSDTEIVVSMEVSTVLFEAICFTKSIYLRKTLYSQFYEPQSIFLPFEAPEELIEAIRKKTLLDIEEDYCWDKRWKSKYKEFIHNTLGIKHGYDH